MRAATVAFLLSCICYPGALSGQQSPLPPAPSDNAALVPRGDMRVSITTHWFRYDRLFGFTNATESQSQPLGVTFSSSAAGSTLFPSLLREETSIAGLAGLPGYQLSLGSIRVRGSVLNTITPLDIEVGVTGFLSLGASLPIINAVGETQVDVNATGNTANVGLNPAALFAPARAASTSVRDQISSASLTLETRLAECGLTPTNPGCDVLLPRSAEAQALIAQSRAFRNSLEGLFGSDTAAPRLVVPLQATAAANAIDSRLAAFSALYRDLLALDPMAADPIAARPFAAETALTAAEFRELLEDPSLGIGILPLPGFRRQGIGDIELRARIKLFDTFAARDDGLAGARASVTVGARVGTGIAAESHVPFDVGTGDGQHDIEIGGAIDVRLSRALAISAQGRFGSQLPDQKPLRIAAPGTAYAELFTLRDVERDLGDYFDFSVRPRLSLGPYASITGSFYVYDKQQDSYTGSFIASGQETGRGDIELDAAILGAGSKVSIQRAGVGLRVANFHDSSEKAPGLPIEFSAIYMTLLGSSGFGVADASTIILQLRTFTRLFGAAAPPANRATTR